MTDPPWNLESLAFSWGDAYLFSYTCDRWVALRRDKRYFITADTLMELEAAIAADYPSCSVSHDFAPPGTTHYLSPPQNRQKNDPGAEMGDEALDAETRLILRELRQLFPQWEIRYSAELRAWMAKSTDGSFYENSMVMICIALTRIEKKRDQKDTNA